MRTTRRFRFLLLALPALLAPLAAWPDYSDCRNCHFDVPPDDVTPDFSGYFQLVGHHPVRVAYPLRPDYRQPGLTQGGIRFFDRNGNGKVDSDEIQIFRNRGEWVVDCASCHIEHGVTAAITGHPPDYVRSAGGAIHLCVTCHNL